MVPVTAVRAVQVTVSASAASVVYCTSYLAAPSTASQLREKSPENRETLGAAGVSGGSSATSVTVTVTVAVAVAPWSSLASTVRG